MPLVEVIPHKGTDPQTIATVVQLAKRQGKTPIVVADKAGFYVNRILAPYINEAMRLLVEGEPIEVIDNALVKFGFRWGRFNCWMRWVSIPAPKLSPCWRARLENVLARLQTSLTRF